MNVKNISVICFLLGAVVCSCGEDNGISGVIRCPDNQTLNRDTGSCEDVTGDSCEEGEPCGTHGICVDNHCDEDATLSGCKKTDECKEGKVCIGGQCVSCQTNEQCGDNKVCKSGKCETNDDSGTCSNNEECGEHMVCDAGHCKPECQSKEDCDAHEDCHSGKCEPVVQDDTCGDDSECQSDELCMNSSCSPKTACGNGCPAGLYCVKGVCDRAKSCESMEQCTDSLVCLNSRCQDAPGCVTTDNCPYKFVCTEEICTYDSLYCEYDDECSGVLTCNENKNKCTDPSIECLDDADCSGILVCKTNKCLRECLSDSDCKNNLVCRQNQCKPECHTDSNCQMPSYCKEQRCTKSCTEDSQCPGDYVCKESQCAEECKTHSDCKGALKKCSGIRCVECIHDEDCSGDDVCTDNKCFPPTELRYPCVFGGGSYTVYMKSSEYELPRNPDGSINICRLGYMPSISEVVSGVEDKCVSLYAKRTWDFYGDGIDSNCDGYDYDLSTAIFVYQVIGGSASGNDSNSGNYDDDSGMIKAKATLSGALKHDNVSIRNEKGQAFSVFPDIILDKDVTSKINAPIEVPSGSDDNLRLLTDLPAYSDSKDAYSFHLAVCGEAKDSTFKPNDYAYMDESTFNKARVRIFGGFSFDVDTPLNWVHRSGDVTAQEYTLDSVESSYYVMIRPKPVSAPLSLSIHDMDFRMNASVSSGIPEGTTFIGLTCGKAGCMRLDLEGVTIDVKAPNGKVPSEVAAAGANGKGTNDDDNGSGVHGSFKEDISSGYSVDTCPQEQKCGDVPSGRGGCGGFSKSNTSGVGLNSAEYSGTPSGTDGDAGTNSIDGVMGGNGGAGLTTASTGYTHDSCGDDSSVLEAKKTGNPGANGTNGANGRQSALALSYSEGMVDELAVTITSNYASAAGIHGQNGGNGGGGGGGAVYQIYSNTFSVSSWVNAGAGGGGGCGGEGGKAGGTGGSAIGLLLKAYQSGTELRADITMDRSKITVDAGSGGYGTDGADGGTGGLAGSEAGHARKNGLSALQCLKATAGGNGGNGGGGGAGAGGIAGKSIAYFFTCSQNVTTDCSEATSEKPCFNPGNRTTLKNCGFILPAHFIGSFNDVAIGKALPGKNMRDSTEIEDGKGSKASRLSGTNGSASFIETYVLKD